MEASWLAVYRALLILSAGLAVVLVYHVSKYRDEPGGKPLLVLILGGLVYIGVKLSVSFVKGTPAALTITRLNPLGAGLAVIGFVSLAIEYTDIEYPISRRTIGVLLVEPVVINVLVWVDIEYLWIPRGPDPNTISGYAWELTGIAIANQLYMNALLLFGILILGRFIYNSERIFRTQGTVIIFAAILPMIGNLSYYVGYTPLNPLPIVFVFSALLLMWGIVQSRFLDLTPISDHAVVNSLNAGVLTVDSDGQLVNFNEASQRMFSPNKSGSVIGRQIEDILSEYPSFIEMYNSVTTGDNEQTQVVESEGQYFRVEVLPLESHNHIVGYTIVIRDITDRKLQQRSLEQKNDRLEKFTSVISHDLRNPIGIAEGYVDLAEETGDHEDFQTVRGALGRMDTMVEELLTMASADTIVEDKESIELVMLAQEAWQTAKTEDATLNMMVDSQATVTGDRDLLLNVFENLFRNAVDHNEPPLTVRVGTLDGAPQGFYIEDDGDGIPEDDREAVFDHGHTTSADGTGLGLYIVEELISAHGWTITVTDGSDGGARFEVRAATNGTKT